jgi:RimJ/RimL family protein N-acetyltransferase
MSDHDIVIRPYEDGDANDTFLAVRESMAELMPWMPWCTPEYALDDTTAWIEATKVGHADGSMHQFAIIANGVFAGGCGIGQINQANQFANLGYWVRTSMAGRGIATAAALKLMSWAFENTRLNRLEIVIAVDNLRSHRVAEKVGARCEGTLRQRLILDGRTVDAVMYSIVRGAPRGAG